MKLMHRLADFIGLLMLYEGDDYFLFVEEMLKDLGTPKLVDAHQCILDTKRECWSTPQYVEEYLVLRRGYDQQTASDIITTLKRAAVYGLLPGQNNPDPFDVADAAMYLGSSLGALYADIYGRWITRAESKITVIEYGCESPIEVALAKELAVDRGLGVAYQLTGVTCYEAGENEGQFYISLQRRIENMRVDMLISSSQHVGSVVIECDGHDYHERTKEQAKRDRSRDRRQQLLGYQVMRFTGSEIYNGVEKCADEVMALLKKLPKQQPRSAP